MIPVKLLYKIVTNSHTFKLFGNFFRGRTASYINAEVTALMMAAFAERQDALHRF